MSTPNISCPKCGNPMPANYQWCPTCGHANAFVSAESAVTPPEPRPNAEAAETTPPETAPTATGGIAATAAGAEVSGMAPAEGTPTVNMAMQGDAARYTPPPDAAAAAGAAGAAAASNWQPGQYNNAPLQAGQPPAPAQPSAYPVAPAQPPQGQNLPAQQPYGQPPAPVYGQPPQQQYPYAANPPKDPTVAFLLELIGYAGVLGIGHIYAGYTTRGIGLLVGWIFYGLLVAALFITIILSPIACLMIIAVPIVPILSGLWVRRDVEKTNNMGRQ